MRRYIWQQDDWPRFQWNNESLLTHLSPLRLQQGRLLERLDGLREDLGMRARGELLVEEAIRTAEIEGEVLDVSHVRSSVARRLGLDTAGLPVPGRREDGLVEVLLDAAEGYQRPLTTDRLFGWHAALFPAGHSGLRSIRVAGWRTADPMQIVSGPIGREVVHYEAPPSATVESEMLRFLEWWHRDSLTLDGLLRAGVAHLWFVAIHPFEDGNGRIARALTDMALAQDEGRSRRAYSLSATILEDRDSYYRVLKEQTTGNLDITEWLRWFLDTVRRAILRTGETLDSVFAVQSFRIRHASTELNPRQRKAVEKLLLAGPAGWEGGLTSRKYVNVTRTSRATATRELADLVDKGILRVSGAGRSVRYDLEFPSVSEPTNPRNTPTHTD